jgi:hypothetical protein
VARAGTSYADDEQAVQPPEDIVIVIALCDNPWMLMDAETHQRYPCPTIELAYRLAPRIPVVLAVDPTPGADGATRYTAVCILAWMLAGIAGVVDLPNRGPVINRSPRRKRIRRGLSVP